MNEKEIDEEIDEVLRRPVKKFSNTGAHLLVPLKHLGKEAIIIIKTKEETLQKQNTEDIEKSKSREDWEKKF